MDRSAFVIKKHRDELSKRTQPTLHNQQYQKLWPCSKLSHVWPEMTVVYKRKLEKEANMDAETISLIQDHWELGFYFAR